MTIGTSARESVPARFAFRERIGQRSGTENEGRVGESSRLNFLKKKKKKPARRGLRSARPKQEDSKKKSARVSFSRFQD